MTVEQPVAPGTILADRYRVRRMLGAGGMGEVYQAEHIELGQVVAVKLLRTSVSEEVIERFAREGRALAQLQSEHVTKIYDVGLLANGRPFIAMEFLRGADLQLVRRERGALPQAEAVDLILQACAGLAEVHGLEIVHRDIKPANLFLVQSPDGRALVKLLDFGIAKVNKAATGGKVGLTTEGDVIGTPRYMSPEQVTGVRDVDSRSDIWSLGTTLLELLSGKNPYAHAQTVVELCMSILNDAPEALSSTRPDLPRALETVLMGSLAKSRDRRYATVEGFAAALAPFGSSGAEEWVRRASALRQSAATRLAQLSGPRRATVTRVSHTIAPLSQTTAVVRIPITAVPTTERLPLSEPTSRFSEPTPSFEKPVPHFERPASTQRVSKPSVTLPFQGSEPAPPLAQQNPTVRMSPAAQGMLRSLPQTPQVAMDRGETRVPQPAQVAAKSMRPSVRLPLPVIGAGVGVLVLLVSGGWWLLAETSSTNSTNRPNGSSAGRVGAAPSALASSLKPLATSKATLPNTLARRPTYEVASQIGELLARVHTTQTRGGAAVQVRDMVFFTERAQLVVDDGAKVARYLYRDGTLSDKDVSAQVPSTKRLSLAEMNLAAVPKIAADAKRRLHGEVLHSVSLYLRGDVPGWVAAGKDGTLHYYDAGANHYRTG